MPAVREASNWLETRATILPVTAEPHNLVMYDEAKDTIVYGEGSIDEYVLSDPNSAKVWIESGEVRNFIEHDPRKVREVLEASRCAPRPNATKEIIEATAYSDIAMVGPGSPITSLRPALQPVGIAGGLARQRDRDGLWVVVANNDSETSAPSLTLDKYIGWMEEDVQRPFSHVIHNDPAAELPERVSISDTPKIRDAIAIGAALVDPQIVVHNPRDPIRHLRAARHTNPYKIVNILRLFMGQS